MRRLLLLVLQSMTISTAHAGVAALSVRDGGLTSDCQHAEVKASPALDLTTTQNQSTGTCLRLSINEKEFWVDQSNLQPVEIKSGFAVYAQPLTTSRKIGAIGSVDMVDDVVLTGERKINADGSKWLQVIWDGAPGWVSAEILPANL